MKRPIPLRLERLEDRTNPSTLTVSFVPDGTQVGSLQSELYKDNVGVSPAVWQQQMLGELQTIVSTATLNTVTLSIVPDDGASMNAAAPEDGAIRIAAVNELFSSTGSVVLPPPGTDFMVAGGSPTTLSSVGLGTLGGLPGLNPGGGVPTGPGSGSSTELLPLSLPVTKAYGNVYTPPPSNPDGTPGL